MTKACLSGSFYSLITKLLNFKSTDNTDGFSLLEPAILYCRKNSPAKNTFKKLKKHFVDFSTAIADFIISNTEEEKIKNLDHTHKIPILVLYYTFFFKKEEGLRLPDNNDIENYFKEFETQDPKHLHHLLLCFPSFYLETKKQKNLKKYFLDELSTLLVREINVEFSFHNILTKPIFLPIWKDWCQKFQSELNNVNSEVRDAFIFFAKKNKRFQSQFKKELTIVTRRKKAPTKNNHQTNGVSELAAKLADFTPPKNEKNDEPFQTPELLHTSEDGNSNFTISNLQAAFKQNSKIKLWAKAGKNNWEELSVSNCKISLKSLNLKPGNHQCIFRFALADNSPKNDFPETETFTIAIAKTENIEPKSEEKTSLKNQDPAIVPEPKTQKPAKIQTTTTEKVEECLHTETDDPNVIILENLWCDFDEAINALLKKITYEVDNEIVHITLSEEYSSLQLRIQISPGAKLISPKIKDLEPDVLEFLYDLASAVWHKNNEKVLALIKKEQINAQEILDKELKEQEKTDVKKWSEKTPERKKLILLLATLPSQLKTLIKKINFDKNIEEIWTIDCKKENKEKTMQTFRSFKCSLQENGIECFLFLENNKNYGIKFSIQHDGKTFCGKSSLNGNICNMKFETNVPTPWQKKLKTIGKGFFSVMILNSPIIKSWQKQTSQERMINKIKKLTKNGLVFRESVWRKIQTGRPIEIPIYDKNHNLIGTETRIITPEELEDKKFDCNLLVKNSSLNFAKNSKESNAIHKKISKGIPRKNRNDFDGDACLTSFIQEDEIQKDLSPKLIELVVEKREEIKNAVENLPEVIEFLEIPRNQKYLARRIYATAQLICNGKVDGNGKEPLRNPAIQKILWGFLSEKCGFKNWEDVESFFESHENTPTKFIKTKLSQFQKGFFRELAQNGFSVLPKEEIVASIYELKLLAKNNFKIPK